MSVTVSETEGAAVEKWVIPWWASLVQGLFSMIIGLLLLTNPAATTIFIVQFIGIYWLVTGVFSITGIFIDRSYWGWKLLSGAIGIFAGLAVVQHPLWSAVLLPTMLVIIMGVNGIMIGLINFFGAFKGGGFSAAVLGIISFLFGVILLSSPGGGGDCRCRRYNGGFLFFCAAQKRRDRFRSGKVRCLNKQMS